MKCQFSKERIINTKENKNVVVTTFGNAIFNKNNFTFNKIVSSAKLSTVMVVHI